MLKLLLGGVEVRSVLAVLSKGGSGD